MLSRLMQLLLLSTGVVLVACGGSSQPASSPMSYVKPEAPVTIEFKTAVAVKPKVHATVEAKPTVAPEPETPATIQPKTAVAVEPKVHATVEAKHILATVPESTPSVELNGRTIEANTTEVHVTSEFTINSPLCQNAYGPNCSKLRLGDDYHSTLGPAKGYLYSCNAKNPGAPGSIESRISWIDFANKTWDFLKKLWLPSGEFDPGPGFYSETLSGDNRQINSNNLPVDGRIGDWPMTNYPTLTEIDRNPGIPLPTSISYSYPVEPIQSLFPNCVSLGAIGVTKNGVIIYNAVDGRGEDAVAREIVDIFGGHPAQSAYHYHFIPEHLDNETLGNGHSGIVGYINDGFPIYGYRGEGGIEMSNDDLDLCHGHKHGSLGYHYHATIEYPYTVGCYMGTSISGSHMQTQEPRANEPATQGRPPPRR